jgi:hypothetical protein
MCCVCCVVCWTYVRSVDVDVDIASFLPVLAQNPLPQHVLPPLRPHLFHVIPTTTTTTNTNTNTIPSSSVEQRVGVWVHNPGVSELGLHVQALRRELGREEGGQQAVGCAGEEGVG